MSVNLEIADDKNITHVAPEKNILLYFSPMRHILQKMLETREDSKRMRTTPEFIPAGKSTQLIVGATSESDNQILNLASKLYTRSTMKHVYYSGLHSN